MPRTTSDEAQVLVVEDDQGLGELLKEEIEDAGMTSRLAHTAEEALRIAMSWLPDLIVSDLRLPGADGLALLSKTQQEIPEGTPDFLIITAFGSVNKAVESLKAGAADFLTKPLDLDHFKLRVTRILEKRKMRLQINRMKALVSSDTTFHGMYGRCCSMLTLFEQIRQVASADGTVLITGESGTGKELAARAIHQEAGPEHAPFLVVNCAGIPEHLLESEFFGHEEGAFTGAAKPRRGIFAEADGGTLLLDEISDMPPFLQAKLLRMLQDGKIRPVGSNKEQQVSVRVVAATNRNIEEEVDSGRFREDLFFRLDTFHLRVPPLREREDDIDLLCGIFINKYCTIAEKNIHGLSERAREMLLHYRFPGNVRELENSIERAVVFCHGKEIMPEHLPARIRKSFDAGSKSSFNASDDAIKIDGDSLPTLDAIERRYIRHVLHKVAGNKRMAASILGITRRTLYRRLAEIEGRGEV